jgi:hypothetical protein
MTIAPDPLLDESAIRVRPGQGEPSMETSHVSALQLKHAGIERQIEHELSRPLPDPSTIQTLKKQKLRIKEQIEHI